MKSKRLLEEFPVNKEGCLLVNDLELLAALRRFKARKEAARRLSERVGASSS